MLTEMNKKNFYVWITMYTMRVQTFLKVDLKIGWIDANFFLEKEEKDVLFVQNLKMFLIDQTKFKLIKLTKFIKVLINPFS